LPKGSFKELVASVLSAWKWHMLTRDSSGELVMAVLEELVKRQQE